MSVTLAGTPGTVATGTSNTGSQSYTLDASAQALVVLVESVDTGAADDSLALTWNGVALTAVDSVASAGSDFWKCKQFKLNAPATGTHSLAWDWNGSSALSHGFIMQILGLTSGGSSISAGTAVKTTGDPANPSSLTSIPSAVGSLIIENVCTGGDVTEPTYGSGQSSISWAAIVVGGHSGGANKKTAGSSSESVSIQFSGSTLVTGSAMAISYDEVAGGSSLTGTGAATQAANTLAGTGQRGRQNTGGGAAIAAAAASLSGTGTVTTPGGAGSWTGTGALACAAASISSAAQRTRSITGTGALVMAAWSMAQGTVNCAAIKRKLFARTRHA